MPIIYLLFGIKLCLCFPVDTCSVQLCLILWVGFVVAASCRMYSCRGSWVREPVAQRSIHGVAIKKPDYCYYSFQAKSMTKRRVGH